MDEEARLGYTEVKIGFVAALVSVILVRAVGEKAAKDLLLTGRLVEAREAKALGLVNRIAPPGKALEEAKALAEEVAKNAPTSLRLTKELLLALPGMGLRGRLPPRRPRQRLGAGDRGPEGGHPGLL